MTMAAAMAFVANAIPIEVEERQLGAQTGRKLHGHVSCSY